MIESGDRVLSRTPLSLNSNLVELGPWYFFLCRPHLLVSSQPCGTHVNCITTPPNSVYLLVSVVDSNSPPTDVMSELLAPRPAFLWGTCSIPSVWARRLIWLINFPREHLRAPLLDLQLLNFLLAPNKPIVVSAEPLIPHHIDSQRTQAKRHEQRSRQTSSPMPYLPYTNGRS